MNSDDEEYARAIIFEARTELNRRTAEMVVDALLENSRDPELVARNMLKEALGHSKRGHALLDKLRVNPKGAA